MSEQETSAEQKPQPHPGSPEPEASSREAQPAPSGAEAQGAAEATATEEPQNRRARRASAARARKQRMRERAEAEAIGLGAQEMLDDAFARSTQKASQWFKNNAALLQWAGIIALAAWAGWGIYDWRASKTKASASDVLAEGLRAQSGVVRDAEDPASSIRDEQDTTPVFDDREAQLKAMREAYAAASDMRSGSGTSHYARLALASTLLRSGDFDEALEHYRQVNASEFTKSDSELRGRALEGVGLALEAKGEHQAALQGYKDLETANIAGFTGLSLYHQARMHRELGQIDQAKEVVKRLQAELPERTALAFAPSFLQQTARALADSLGVVEPEQAPSALEQPITPEQLRELQEQVQRQIDQRSQQPTSGGPSEEGSTAPAEPAAPPAENP